MNTKTLIAIVVIALVLIGGYFLVASRAAAPAPEDASESVVSETQEEEPIGDNEYAALVTYTDGGFSPASVSVKAGDTVRFVNNSAGALWVGADEHPTHTEYDGTSTREHCVDGAAVGGAFDMCRRSVPGEFWEYTFTKAGSFDYHNHAQASHGGTIVVTE